MTLDPRLLEMLRCPACRATVSPSADQEELRCSGCGRRYPVRDGIPVMLVDEAHGPEPDDSNG